MIPIKLTAIQNQLMRNKLLRKQNKFKIRTKQKNKFKKKVPLQMILMK